MTPWVRRLIVANIIVFFVQYTMPGVTGYLAYVPALLIWQPWTVITYMFAHANITHIGFNMLALYFFGPAVEERLGARRFLTLYFLSGIVGALLSTLFAFRSPIIGASGAIMGVMFAFARYWPHVRLLLFFIVPVEARVAVFLMAALALWSGYNGSTGGVADFAHLGGFLGAWLYLLWVERQHGTRKFRAQITPKVAKDALMNWKRVDPRSVHEVNRDEVNRILDKISAHGLGSLTPQERLFLSNFVPPDDRVPPPT